MGQRQRAKKSHGLQDINSSSAEMNLEVCLAGSGRADQAAISSFFSLQQNMQMEAYSICGPRSLRGNLNTIKNTEEINVETPSLKVLLSLSPLDHNVNRSVVE